jgi:hypothetical protein
LFEIINDELFIGNGTDKSHFNACFSCLKLLQKLDNIGQFHVDCTYKIIKYFYPLLVFGITDFNRHFHPIAFMVTSHETELDFKFFFSSLDTIAKELKIQFDIKTIVSDACHAMFNAINAYYKDNLPSILMCWFHLKLNVKKHKKLIPENMYDKVMRVINSMHTCKCKEDFDVIVVKNVNKWLQMTSFTSSFTC